MRRVQVLPVFGLAVAGCAALAGCSSLSGDGDGNDLPPLPSACTLEPAAISVAPQSVIEFTGACGGADFNVEGDAGHRTWSPDGYLSAFEYNAPEVPGQYTIQIAANRDDTVRGVVVVTVLETTYPVRSDLLWSWGLESIRLRVVPDDTVLVQSKTSEMHYLDGTLSLIDSQDEYYAHYAGDFRWSKRTPGVVYQLGVMNDVVPSFEALFRYDLVCREVRRYYHIPNRATGGDWTLALSEDELQFAIWNDGHVFVRELEGETVAAHVWWDPQIRRWILTGKAYPEEVLVEGAFTSHAVFSADNAWVVLGASLVMELATGLLVERDLESEPVELFDPELGAISPDGRRRYSWGAYDERFRAWPASMTDAASGAVLWSHRHADTPGAAFFADSGRIAIANFGDATDADTRHHGVSVVDVETGEVLAERTIGPSGNQQGEWVRWSPDGAYLLARYDDGRGTTFMFTESGDPLWETAATDLGFVNFVGAELAGIVRDPTTRDITSLRFLEPATRAAVRDVVLEFEHRVSRFLDDRFYANPDGSLLWIDSEAMAEGGMGFDLSTGAWLQDVRTAPDWVVAQRPPRTPLGSEPTQVCNGATPCVLHYVCGAWDPTGRYLVEAWNAGASDVRSDILSFRIVDSTGTIRRDIVAHRLGACTAAAWHPSEMRVAVLDRAVVHVYDTSQPNGRD